LDCWFTLPSLFLQLFLQLFLYSSATSTAEDSKTPVSALAFLKGAFWILCFVVFIFALVLLKTAITKLDIFSFWIYSLKWERDRIENRRRALVEREELERDLRERRERVLVLAREAEVEEEEWERDRIENRRRALVEREELERRERVLVLAREAEVEREELERNRRERGGREFSAGERSRRAERRVGKKSEIYIRDGDITESCRRSWTLVVRALTHEL
jgi:hypothetical protein